MFTGLSDEIKQYSLWDVLETSPCYLPATHARETTVLRPVKQEVSRPDPVEICLQEDLVQCMMHKSCSFYLKGYWLRLFYTHMHTHNAEEIKALFVAVCVGTSF